MGVIEGLRHGVTTGPLIDPRSRWIYAIMAAEFAIGLPVFLLMGFTLDLPSGAAIGAGALIFACWLLRFIGHSRLAGGVEIVIVAFFYGLPVMFVVYPLLALSAPLADPWLARTDDLLGFDWFAFIRFFKAHPQLTELMVRVYKAFFWQELLIVPLLWICRLEWRAWAFVTMILVAMVITLTLYPFAPADDAFVHYGVTRAAFPLSVDVPWTTSPVVRSIKAGARVISVHSLVGIVTFPSFHAATAVLFTWATWALKPLRYPILVLNCLMLVSCVVVGAHYVIDLIVGVLIGGAAILIVTRLLLVEAKWTASEPA
jgi:membrane-associated phospholipid phosphatase